MAMVTFRLDDETNARLTAAALNSGRSKTQIIKTLINENLDVIEALEPFSVTMARYRKDKAEGKQFMNHDEFTQAISDLLS